MYSIIHCPKALRAYYGPRTPLDSLMSRYLCTSHASLDTAACQGRLGRPQAGPGLFAGIAGPRFAQGVRLLSFNRVVPYDSGSEAVFGCWGGQSGPVPWGGTGPRDRDNLWV